MAGHLDSSLGIRRSLTYHLHACSVPKLYVYVTAGQNTVYCSRLGARAFLQEQCDSSASHWLDICCRGQLRRSPQSLPYWHQLGIVRFSPSLLTVCTIFAKIRSQLAFSCCRRALAVQLYLKIDRIQQADEQVKVRLQVCVLKYIAQLSSTNKCCLNPTSSAHWRCCQYCSALALGNSYITNIDAD